MIRKKINIGSNSKRMLVLSISIVIIFSVFPSVSAYSAGTPEAFYTGDSQAFTVFKNLDYQDISDSGSWAAEAIYETGAIGVMKGFGNRRFGSADLVSREEAVALVYTAAGREAEGQMAAEALDSIRPGEDKKTDALGMWYDGFLQLAEQDGLISRQDLNDAYKDQTTLELSDFNRKAPVTRQEMAFWLAKLLNLEPMYGQQRVFNSYNDWKSADPVKVPYIESILQNSIMTGDDSGYFRPLQPLNREQAAQVLKNAGKFILPVLNLEKKVGTIEDISYEEDYSDAAGFITTKFDIRSINGKLHRITTHSPIDYSGSYRSEQDTRIKLQNEKELVVYKNAMLGNSSFLEIGDRIEYIVSTDSIVKFVKVVSNKEDVRYVAARVNSVDKSRSLIDVTQLFVLDYPDLTVAGSASFDMESEWIDASYKYSSDAYVIINSARSAVDELKADMYVMLTILNNNIVTAVKTIDFWQNPEGMRVVKGIVEENNPQLGYITLYNEDGSGIEASMHTGFYPLRIFNYVNPNSIEVYKNHEPAGMDDVEAGDTAFLRLDDNGNVTAVSAADNYTVKYGRVLYKLPSGFTIKYDDGTEQALTVESDALFIAGGRLSSFGRLMDGDRVRLILHITDRFTRVKEVTIEGGEHFVTNIYKGSVSRIDNISGKLVVQNLEAFDRGRWTRTGQKGFVSIRIADKCRAYVNDGEINMNRVNKYLSDNDAYIAVEKDYGGEERVVLVSFRNEDDTEVLYDDSVSGVKSGTGRFSLSGMHSSIKFQNSSIVVKDGRLVAGNSISDGDMAYAAVNRSYDTGEYIAGVVEIRERPDNGLVSIYRGRVKKINEGKDFTVESFSRLKGVSWQYSNTPKTFTITYDTSMLDDEGIIGQQEFTGYGENSFTGRTVYILADSANAVLVSTAPYGTCNASGEVYKVVGREEGENGGVLDEPTEVTMRNVKVYNPSDHIWEDSGSMTLNILKNSMIIKDGKAIKPSGLKKGDRIRVIKKNESKKADAYIIFIEN